MKQNALTAPRQRNSNLELLRIIMMLIIIAHHYIVNSDIGLAISTPPKTYALNYAFSLCFGFGGKMAINVFILISGYFMCQQQFKWKKLINLICLMVFYKYVIYGIFLITGYETFSLAAFAKTVLFIPLRFGQSFAPSFLGLYVLCPFLNLFLQHADKKTMQRLLIILLVLFTGFSSFLLNTSFEYLGWYVTVYLIGSYLRLYPIAALEKKKTCLWLFLLNLALCWCSVLIVSFAEVKMQRTLPHFWFVADSNKILAITTAISMFCLFKTLNLGSNKIINTISASTFGIFLIHTSSATMRNWLWNDIMQAGKAYAEPLFPLYACGAVVTVYLACFCIDYARRNVLLLCKQIRK